MVVDPAEAGKLADAIGRIGYGSAMMEFISRAARWMRMVSMAIFSLGRTCCLGRWSVDRVRLSPSADNLPRS